MNTEYKGERIAFNEDREVWAWATVENASLKAVKAAIERARKQNLDIPILWKAEQGILYPGKVTSIIPSVYDSYTKQAWISYTERGRLQRSKESLSRLIEDTPANRKRVVEIAKIVRQKNILSKKRDRVELSLTHVKTPKATKESADAK